ncbi:YveK family protein [Paenibacillus odorifer]|uniref:YveK family protein n=1 Tax=Paenibacillus odorifer TaxID=189426 RepID=UPI000B9FA586|nr:Wzz/FepE/Etk N-terminal domain-containing protein [Paenibacillus odorifer]OZQ76522.1 hypothetical protein CA596_09840 [Paenibacillus odorifer]
MEFELGSILKLVKRRLLFIIVLCIAAVGLAGSVSYYVLQPKYEATASILIQGDRQQKAINDIMAGQKLVTTYGEIIRSSRIAEEVVRKLQLKMTAEELLKNVKTRTNSESLVTTVIVTDSKAQRATDIANGFGEAFNANIQSIMGVENVVFLDRAKVPSDPVSPKPVFNMAVAFGLALITGIAISILRELMEKPVRSAKDIQLDLQLPLLGTVGKLKPRKRRNKTKTKSAEGATSYEEENAKIILPGTTEVI